MDFSPEAHALFTVNAGTSCGTLLRMEICRAGFGPPPACRALPKIVSSSCSGCTPARSSAALAATTPRSTAESEASEPPNLPMGVRTAERMYTLFKRDSLTFQSSKLQKNITTGDTEKHREFLELSPVFLCVPCGEEFSRDAHAVN